MEDDPLNAMVMFDRLEIPDAEDHPLVWEGHAWVGRDLQKLYFYSEGEAAEGDVEESENALLYSRAVSPYWDLQLGIGYDTIPGSHQTWGIIAAQGMAPYFFEVRAALLVGEDGNIGLRLAAEYDALLTQRLILTPSLEADLYAKDTPEMELGRGLSFVQAGMRLRYEFYREFAPYIGVEWVRNVGRTNDCSPLNDTRAVAGARFWF
jgi:copper resistance protein B